MGGACRSYRVRMIRRRVLPASAAVWLTAATLALTGCGDPAPTPTPTPTGFASEAEAFAAAEETYRAYVDALNQVDLSDPTTFEEVYRWTTGDLNASDRESFSAWHANGYSLVGKSRIQTVAPLGVSTLGQVTLAACYDVSRVDIRTKEGISVVAPDRTVVQALEVVVDGPGRRVAAVNATEDLQC